MGEPTNVERGLPPSIDDPAFLDWAKRNGTPISAVTPYQTVLDLFEKYTYELRDAAREKQAKQKRSERELAKSKRADAEKFSRTVQKAHADAKLTESIANSFSFNDPSLEREAKEAVRKMVPLQKRLSSQFWESTKRRWAYIRYYMAYYHEVWGDPLSQGDLLKAVIAQEQSYRQREEENKAQAEWRAEPTRERASLRTWAASQALNLVTSFDDGIAYYGLNAAIKQTQWVDRDITNIEQKDYKLDISYRDGGTLHVPVSIIDFTGEYRSKIRDILVRRHKSTGRLFPCAIYEDDVDRYSGLPTIDRLTAEDRVLIALPFFDSQVTPNIFSFYSQQNIDLWVAMKVARIAAIWAGAKALPIGVRGGAAVASTSYGLAARSVGLGRAALTDINFAIQSYGFTTQAGLYLARSTYVFYLSNYATINTIAAVGAEFTLSMYGQDMGPMSPGDTLTMAVQEEKAIGNAIQKEWKAVSAELESLDEVSGMAKLRITSVNPLAEDVAKSEFNLGKNVLSDGRGRNVRMAKGLDTASTDARLASSAAGEAKAIRGVSDDSKAIATTARGKGKAKLPPDPRPKIAAGEWEAGMRDFQSKIQKLSSKYDPKALEKISNLSADALREAQLHPKDLRSLANSLSRAGKETQKFVNTFHNTPGFENVLLNWAKRRYYNSAKGTWVETKAFYRGTSFFIKYANAKLDPKKVRFEWPASINDAKWGDEVFARYVDVIIDGADTARPGQRIYLELKSWTDLVLKMKTKDPRGIRYQLTRDTALFSPDNILWVFDGSKVKEKTVLKAFEEIILGDEFLSARWGGKAHIEAIRANLKKVIQIF